MFVSETTKSTNDNDFDDFVGAPSKSNTSSNNGSNNNGQFSSNSNDLKQLGPVFGDNHTSASEKDNVGVMSKDSIMALFNKPQSTSASNPNPNSMSSNGVGQQAFTGFPTSFQTNTTSFPANMSGGVGTAGHNATFTNNTAALGGINFHQQAPVLGKNAAIFRATKRKILPIWLYPIILSHIINLIIYFIFS